MQIYANFCGRHQILERARVRRVLPPSVQRPQNTSCIFPLYVLECAKFVRKYPGKFTTVRDNPNCRVYSTRNTIADESDIFVPLVTLNITAQSPLVMIARIYNHLPSELKQIESEVVCELTLKSVERTGA
jgi:hypothetical protein